MKTTPRELIRLLSELDPELLDEEIEFYGCDGMVQYFDCIQDDVNHKYVHVYFKLDN